MTEAEALRAQLDRIEAKLDRLGRVEERQNHQARALEKLEVVVDGQGQRLNALEKAHAITVQQATGRWATAARFVNIAATISSTVLAGLLLQGVLL
jgi:hypothetical protein|tara:strand:+ start:8620 stop:8907 length:288 start_codon:yes stop_codon:yes gene_type:complete